MLTRLIYFSENRIDAGDGRMIPQLNAILDASNRNNERCNITGALLFDRHWFVQLLEGDRDAVNATYRRLIQDPRHANITIMAARDVSARMFGSWWMGAAALKSDHRALLERHGMGGRFDPTAASGDQLLALALDLTGQGLERNVNPALMRSFALARSLTGTRETEQPSAT